MTMDKETEKLALEEFFAKFPHAEKGRQYLPDEWKNAETIWLAAWEARGRASVQQGPIAWLYRNKNTGHVLYSEQPPDRVSNLTEFEVTEVLAASPQITSPAEDITSQPWSKEQDFIDSIPAEKPTQLNEDDACEHFA